MRTVDLMPPEPDRCFIALSWGWGPLQATGERTRSLPFAVASEVHVGAGPAVCLGGVLEMWALLLLFWMSRGEW